MSAPISNSRLRVPHGFQALLEGFTREVLRNQPADIYAFGALYFEEMLRRREETGEEDPAQLALRLQDRMRNGAAFGDGPQIGDPSDARQQQASVVIQADYRRRAAQREAEQLRRDRAAGDIQAAVRGHQERRLVDGGRAEASRGFRPQDDEEIDIDLDDPEVAAAAEKIQAGFKGYKTRKQMKQRSSGQGKQKPAEEEVDIDLTDPEVAAAAEKIQAGFKGYKTRKQMKQQKQKTPAPARPVETEVDIDLNDPEVGAAAEKIQAGFKGYKTRKQMKEQKRQQPQHPKASGRDGQEEEVDIDLNDPEVGAAAEKIQAGFKGYKTRKQMKEQKRQQTVKPTVKKAEADTEVDIDLNDPEVAAAAEKIQAGFKGYKTRKQMKQQPAVPQASSGSKSVKKSEDADEVDIDLNDPEVGAAAEKIQAGFKGYKTRKQMKEQKQRKAGNDNDEHN